MKFISEKAASKATPDKVIAYIFDGNKVCRDANGDVLMGTIGLDDERPYAEQFRETALRFGNSYHEDERKYYHYKYTVGTRDYDPPNGIINITPEQLLEEGLRFCRDNLDGYQAIVVVQYHDNSKSGKILDRDTGRWLEDRIKNKKHLHAHIITNACPYDFDLGMLRKLNKDIDNMRDYAYKAGQKYNLNERDWREEAAEKWEEKKRKKEEQERTKAARGEKAEGINQSEGEKIIIDKYGAAFAQKSFKERYRIAIDEAISEVTTFDSFKEYLKEEFSIKTEVTQTGNIKFKFPDRTSFTSGKILGENYTLDSILDALDRSKETHKDVFVVPTELVEQYRDTPVLSIESIRWRNKIIDELTKYRDWEEEMRQQDLKWMTDNLEPYAMANRDRMILKKTAEFHRLYQQAANDAALNAALDTAEKEEIEELLRYLNLLKMDREKQKEELLRIRVRYTVVCRVHYPNRIGRYDEFGRERTVAELVFILAKLMLENKFGPREPPQYDYNNDPIIAKVDWKTQNLINAARIARELGTNSIAEMELAVKKEGRKLGEAKQAYFNEKKECEKAIAAASSKVAADALLTDEERKEKILRIREIEMQRLEPLEKKYQAAKRQYKDYARAVDVMREQQYSIYRTEIEEIKRRATQESKQPKEAMPVSTQQEQPCRSKAEAKRIEEKQWQDIRDWSDMAIDAIADKPDVGADWNLREWAKEMEKQGCVVRITKQTISIQHPESNYAVRMNRLGGAYEKEYIVNGISSRKQEYREQAEADRRRAEAEQDAAAERAYGEAVRRAAAGIDNDRAERHDDRRAEVEIGRNNTAECGSDPAGRIAQDVLRQSRKDRYSGRLLDYGGER